jgi:hypothetical protein
LRKFSRDKRAVSSALVVVFFILGIVLGTLGTLLVTSGRLDSILGRNISPPNTSGPPGNPLATSENVASGTFVLPSPCSTCYNGFDSTHKFSFIIPVGAKNAELKGNFNSNASVNMEVINQANYSRYGGWSTTAFYQISQNSDSFDFLVPAGDTYYILFNHALYGYASITVSAVLTYS